MITDLVTAVVSKKLDNTESNPRGSRGLGLPTLKVTNLYVF